MSTFFVDNVQQTQSLDGSTIAGGTFVLTDLTQTQSLDGSTIAGGTFVLTDLTQSQTIQGTNKDLVGLDRIVFGLTLITTHTLDVSIQSTAKAINGFIHQTETATLDITTSKLVDLEV